MGLAAGTELVTPSSNISLVAPRLPFIMKFAEVLKRSPNAFEGMTPGESSASWNGLRWFSGRFTIWRFSMTFPTAPDWLSTRGGAEVTSTESLNAPNTIVKLTTSRSLTRTSIFGCTSLRNPGASTPTRYTPGLNAGNEYSPCASDSATAATLLSISVAVSLALGTAAPDGSATVPATVPVIDCAFSTAAPAVNSATKVSINAKFLLIGLDS